MVSGIAIGIMKHHKSILRIVIWILIPIFLGAGSVPARALCETLCPCAPASAPDDQAPCPCCSSAPAHPVGSLQGDPSPLKIASETCKPQDALPLATVKGLAEEATRAKVASCVVLGLFRPENPTNPFHSNPIRDRSFALSGAYSIPLYLLTLSILR